MSEQSPVPKFPECLKGQSKYDLHELQLRDYVYGIVGDLDFDAQLEAMHGLLRRNHESEEALSSEIKQAEEHARKLTGIRGEAAVNRQIDLIHSSVYQDASHSMAAVGMLAPFFESMFTECFRGIGKKWSASNTPSNSSTRWQASREIQWDCHNVLENGRIRTDLVKGILQLADSIGIHSRFPVDIEKTLSALFGYRNKMFHHGLEWPEDERIKFENRIKHEQWSSNWFSSAKIGERPWIFYMSPDFIEHCLATIDSVLIVFGEYARDLLADEKELVR